MCLGHDAGLVNRRTALGLGAASLLLVGGLGRRPTAGTVRGVAVAPGLDIYPRETWASGMPQLAKPPPEDVRFLLVHHTASPNDYDEDGAIATMRSAYRLHTGPEKGWPDVAYNFFVDRFGRVFEGRDGSLEGAVTADATGGSQGFAQLVCLLGDFTSEVPTAAALSSLHRVLVWMADRFDIATDAGATATFVSRGSNRWPTGTSVTTPTICGHRDMSATACPGDAFYPYVRDTLQADVDALRASLAPATTTTTTTIAATTTTSPSMTTSTTSTSSSTIPTESTTSATSSPTTSTEGDDDSAMTGPLAVVAIGAAAAAAGTWLLRRRNAAPGDDAPA